MTSEESDLARGRREAIKTVAWGLAWLVGAGWFWLCLTGNPIHELLLILRAQTASGQIVDTWEDVQEGDDGRAHWFHGASYKFALPDGRQITASTGTRSGRLAPGLVDLHQPFPAEVEYDPADPSISRVKGDGSQTVSEWLLRKLGVGGILLVLFASPGVKSGWAGAGTTTDAESSPVTGPGSARIGWMRPRRLLAGWQPQRAPHLGSRR